jgi:tRNASer (uridine44-2'-O)-methyltransferase
MSFAVQELGTAADSHIYEQPPGSTRRWRPLYEQECQFDSTIFTEVMLNLIKNPNINSSWLFRADILHDEQGLPSAEQQQPEASNLPSIPAFSGLQCQRYMIRKLIPRNTSRDAPLDQTCLIYDSDIATEQEKKTLVVYLPHVASPDDMPFYHPKVEGIAFLHRWDSFNSRGSLSISYLFFPDHVESNKLMRTALNLLGVTHKHGEGQAAGYVKRVHHDLLIPQATFQNRYAALKHKYAKSLTTTWAETTDPTKHVFEDLGIAAFLLQLWDDMYADKTFPGFVDIGCGNGLLVYILNQEGYLGWGFDARTRKSWAAYNTTVQMSSGSQDSLKQLVLIPALIGSDQAAEADIDDGVVHDGRFPKGTFIISNHADELTPWTPILAAESQCPFIMIPCCSHDLTGSRYRAPPPKDKTKSESAYSSLVAWVTEITRDCGWEVETEMLRIPSTRNTGLVGRTRAVDYNSIDLAQIIRRYGGAGGYVENASKLAKSTPRGH